MSNGIVNIPYYIAQRSLASWIIFQEEWEALARMVAREKQNKKKRRQKEKEKAERFLKIRKSVERFASITCSLHFKAFKKHSRSYKELINMVKVINEEEELK